MSDTVFIVFCKEGDVQSTLKVFQRCDEASRFVDSQTYPNGPLYWIERHTVVQSEKNVSKSLTLAKDTPNVST